MAACLTSFSRMHDNHASVTQVRIALSRSRTKETCDTAAVCSERFAARPQDAGCGKNNP
jgi:hypothetical protein